MAFNMTVQDPFSMAVKDSLPPHSSHPAFGHLVLLVFEAVLEVVCVSLPGYIVARQGMFDADAQKFVANMNVMIFTPCLIFTKLASQLNADKLVELAVIPFIFATQTLVSYLCSVGMSKLFGFRKRPRNFVVAMGVFGNSNSLPISLVISLSQTLKGLHWDKVPGDNDDEVAARGILYLLIFQQLGQLVRWSWGYHVLLAPPEKFEEEDQHTNSQLEQGRYHDDPEEEGNGDSDDTNVDDVTLRRNATNGSYEFESGEQTPVNHRRMTNSMSSKASAAEDRHGEPGPPPELMATPTNGNVKPYRDQLTRTQTSRSVRSVLTPGDGKVPDGVSGYVVRFQRFLRRSMIATWDFFANIMISLFQTLPKSVQNSLSMVYRQFMRFLGGVWDFMNPPLWAMLVAIIVASVPALHSLFFSEGSFIANSATRAVSQSGGVAVPLILVVLGANLARNTLPSDPDHTAVDEKEDKKLLIASLVSRMLLPTIIMAPLLAITAKYVPVSILDDPIFVIVCFLLTGAPSALQLAQICQINGVYMGVMSKLLFQSYVIWILPSTLILVMLALEVVEWAAA
ncbi:hypothetical protein MMC11_000461 [Xylographa trunciseda]|nr:hypothetical protein [Xylographa trunciseda]